jgi:hypothetical protein
LHKPPDVVWHALINYIDPAEVEAIGWAAYSYGRWEYARAGFHKAVYNGYLPAASALSYCLGNAFGDERGAIEVLRNAITHAQAPNGSSRIDPVQLLEMKGDLAWWTGLAGDATKARRLAQEVVDDSERILGAEHRKSVLNRLNLARWTGKFGDTAEALRLALEVATESRRILGNEDHVTMTARFEVAVWTGYHEDAAKAVLLWQELDADVTRADGDNIEFIMDIRRNLAFWMFIAGDIDHGLPFLENVTADHIRTLGQNHPMTLSARVALAHAVGQTGHPEEALFRWNFLWWTLGESPPDATGGVPVK